MLAARNIDESIFCARLMRLVIGTFARVWLVRLANAKPEDHNKVFALKKLRKTDGMTDQSR